MEDSQNEISQKTDLGTEFIRLKDFIDDYEQFNSTNVNDRVAVATQSLEEVFKSVASMRSNVTQHNHETSFLFNFFDLFRVNENSMSKILAFLLNPKGKHGQGDLYFKEFCEYFDLQIPPYKSFYIRCEESTDINRRIDLLIKAGDYFIIIENKFRGAVDQKHQLKHYYEFITSKAKFDDNVYLFYMNQYGNEPSEYTFPRKSEDEISVWEKLHTSKKLITVPFKQHLEHQHSIYKYFEICKDKSKSVKMRFFIEDIMHHISRENKMSKYKEQMFSWLSETPERTENAYDVFRMWDDYKKYVIQTFLKEFETELNQALSDKFKVRQFKALKYKDIFSESHSGYRVFIRDDYHVYIQSDKIGFDGIHYGLAPLHNGDKDPFKRNMDLTLRDKILKNYPVAGGFTEASVVKYESTIRDLSSINDFTKLLPINKKETMSIWIDEVTSLIKFLITPEYLDDDLKVTQ